MNYVSDYQQWCNGICAGTELNFIWEDPDPVAEEKPIPKCFCGDRNGVLRVGWIYLIMSVRPAANTFICSIARLLSEAIDREERTKM